MSIIERALQRSRNARAAKVEEIAPTEAPEKVILQWESADMQPSASGTESLIDAPSPVTITGQVLRSTGLLPPADLARLQAGQYRNVRRMLAEQMHGKHGQGGSGVFVAVTSAMAGDGKTYTAFNLAMSFSREPDHETVLIDADLPKRQLTQYLGLSDAEGLADCLVGSRNLDDAFLTTDVPRLYVLPAGCRYLEGSELLGGTKFQSLFEHLRSRRPGLNIILDTGPLLMSAEAEMLSRNVPQALLVVRSGVSGKKSVVESLTRMGDKPAISLLLNAWEPSLFEEQANYGDYYGSMA